MMFQEIKQNTKLLQKQNNYYDISNKLQVCYLFILFYIIHTNINYFKYLKVFKLYNEHLTDNIDIDIL